MKFGAKLVSFPMKLSAELQEWKELRSSAAVGHFCECHRISLKTEFMDDLFLEKRVIFVGAITSLGPHQQRYRLRTQRYPGPSLRFSPICYSAKVHRIGIWGD